MSQQLPPRAAAILRAKLGKSSTLQLDVHHGGRESSGPGTELKKLLKRFGITPTVNCKCNDRAAQMDRNGADWCKANLETIVGWLAEEAKSRHLPFSPFVGRRIIRRAIRNAKKN